MASTEGAPPAVGTTTPAVPAGTSATIGVLTPAAPATVQRIAPVGQGFSAPRQVIATTSGPAGAKPPGLTATTTTGMTVAVQMPQQVRQLSGAGAVPTKVSPTAASAIAAVVARTTAPANAPVALQGQRAPSAGSSVTTLAPQIHVPGSHAAPGSPTVAGQLQGKVIQAPIQVQRIHAPIAATVTTTTPLSSQAVPLSPTHAPSQPASSPPSPSKAAAASAGPSVAASAGPSGIASPAVARPTLVHTMPTPAVLVASSSPAASVATVGAPAPPQLVMLPAPAQAATAAAAVVQTAPSSARTSPPGPAQTVRSDGSPRDSDEDSDDDDLDWVRWNPDDVGNWADNLLGPGCGEPFRRHKIDGPTLLGLTENDLRDPLGFKDPLQCAKLFGHFRAFQVGMQVRASRLSRSKRSARKHRRAGSDGQTSHAASSPTIGSAAPPRRPREALGEVSPPQGTGFRRRPPDSPPVPPSGFGLVQAPHHSMRSLHTSSSTPVVTASGALSRSPSATSSIQSGGFHTASQGRVTRQAHLSRSPSAGVNSNFGGESPSDSVRGSFAQAQRLRDKYENASPGPAAYASDTAHQHSAQHSSSFRATIGNSPRRTENGAGTSTREYDLPVPGPHSYNATRAEASLTRSPRAIFGSSPRNTSWHTSQVSETQRRGPGPASYDGAAVNRVASPSATIGKSARDTLQFIANQDPCAGAPTVSRCGSQGRLASPKIRGGVIGTSSRSPRTIDQEVPGPCSYDVARQKTERTGRTTCARIGNARRDTCEYMVRCDDAQRLLLLAQASSGEYRGKSKGGVIGSAPRWGTAAAGTSVSGSSSPLPSPGTSPGPMTYHPKPMALSTFR